MADAAKTMTDSAKMILRFYLMVSPFCGRKVAATRLARGFPRGGRSFTALLQRPDLAGQGRCHRVPSLLQLLTVQQILLAQGHGRCSAAQ